MQIIRQFALAGTVVFGAISAGLGPAAHAQDGITLPQPLEQTLPEAPQNRAGMPVEGWVVLRYSILPDGKTDKVRTIDRMPPQLSDREAIAAARAWTFEPAKADGAPVEWHNNETVVVYDVDTVPLGPSAPFVQAYLEVEELIKSQDFDKALKNNERMLSTVTSRLGEVGLAQMQHAIINLSLGDMHAAYAAIQRATDPRIPVLTVEDLSTALQYRNVLELELGDAVAALETYARRNEIEPLPASDVMVSRAATIEAGLGSDAAIVIKAKVADDYWRHTPARRTFAIGEVDGDIDTIQVECNRRGAELEYSADAEWSLPESWGDCSLMIEGRRNTEFLFYEFP